MVLRTAFHKVSFQQTRDLVCFADSSSNSMESATIFRPDPIATIQQRCLPLLCALLFQQSHLFLIYVVLTWNDSRKDLHKICQILGIVNVNDFRFPRRLQELLQALLSFLRSFCFARIRLDPLCTGAFSARSPWNVGSQADIAISVVREESKKMLCLPDTTFARGSEGNS